MSICRRVVPWVLAACLLGGCYEDTVELTLNADGSGTIKQKLVFSERFMVAISEGDASPSGPVADKAELVEKIGSAIKITSIEQTARPDGSSAIELEGTFSNAEQFFLSEYCREQVKLRIASAGKGKAAIYCDMKNSSGQSSGPSLTQLYGLAKGLYVKRTVHVPGKIEKSNADVGKAKNTVSWASDLRNKAGLERTKAFVEGPDKGEGYVVFDASGLEFSLPLKAANAPEKPGEKPTTKAASGDLKAEVTWISVQRAKEVDGTEKSDMSYTEIGVKLTWDEGNRPSRYNQPVLLSLSDDLGNDLVTSKKPSVFLNKIYDHQKSKELKLKEKVPALKAGKLVDLEGYVEVVTGVVKELVVLENVQGLVGKDSTGNPALDKLNFKIKSIKGRNLRISGKDVNKRITSVFMIKEDGTKIKKRSGGGQADDWSYGFDEDISKLTRCELEVVVAETLVKVPFSLKEVSLP